MKKHFLRIVFVVLSIFICITLTVSANSSFANYHPDNIAAKNFITNDTVNSYVNYVNVQSAYLATSNLGDISATITFSESMSSNELETYVSSYNIQTVQLQARGYDENGDRITFFSRTDAGIEKTYQILEEMARDGKIEFAGVIGMYVFIDSTCIEAIQKDEKTFLLDTSSNNYIVDENIISSVQTNEIISTEQNKSHFVHSIAWDIESLGIVSYNVID